MEANHPYLALIHLRRRGKATFCFFFFYLSSFSLVVVSTKSESLLDFCSGSRRQLMGALAASDAASSPLRMIEQHRSFGRVCPSFNSNPVRCMASSTVPSPTRLKGDSFIREHLRRLSPYQPILPFEVAFELMNSSCFFFLRLVGEFCVCVVFLFVVTVKCAAKLVSLTVFDVFIAFVVCRFCLLGLGGSPRTSSKWMPMKTHMVHLQRRVFFFFFVNVTEMPNYSPVSLLNVMTMWR